MENSVNFRGRDFAGALYPRAVSLSELQTTMTDAVGTALFARTACRRFARAWSDLPPTSGAHDTLAREIAVETFVRRWRERFPGKLDIAGMLWSMM